MPLSVKAEKSMDPDDERPPEDEDEDEWLFESRRSSMMPEGGAMSASQSTAGSRRSSPLPWAPQRSSPQAVSTARCPGPPASASLSSTWKLPPPAVTFLS